MTIDLYQAIAMPVNLGLLYSGLIDNGAVRNRDIVQALHQFRAFGSKVVTQRGADALAYQLPVQA